MTDTAIHCFEKAGLGRAPFRCVGLYSIPSPSLAEQNVEAYNNALRMMPRGLGCGTCNYCGTAIMHNFIVESLDGTRFVVGSDCVARTGDAGLVREVRAERLKVVRAKREESRALGRKAREAVWAAERAERAAAFKVQYAALIELAAGHMEVPFVKDVMERLLAGGFWSERAIEAVERVCVERNATEARRASSKHVGEVGKRLKDVSVRVVRKASYERPAYGRFGYETCWIISMVDPAGNTLVSKSSSFYADKGAELVIAGTVKEHSEYNGEKQTVLQRIKVK